MPNNMIPIPGRLHAVDTNGVATGANEIFDDDLNLRQSEVNTAIERPYNSTTPNGMGRVVLKKNKTFASQVTQENTIYVIQYDFDLDGAEITIPENCVLLFDGGSLSNGIANASGNVRIVGYGWKLKFYNYVNGRNITFENPYCVDTTNGLSNSLADGSPSKPFYYLQDALNVCNNIVIKRNSVLNIKQAKYTYDIESQGENTYTLAPIGICKTNTYIGAYGVGKKPQFTGLVRMSNISKSYADNILTIDIDNTTFTGSDGETITRLNYKKMFNFSTFYTSAIRFATVAYRQVYKDEINGIRQWAQLERPQDEETHKLLSLDNSKLYFYATSNNFYSTNTFLAGIGGISGNLTNTVTIENCQFDHLGDGVFNIYGDTYGSVSLCEFLTLGGEVMTASQESLVLYGNGVDVYLQGNNRSSNIEVSNCLFCDIFDAAITIQTHDSNVMQYYSSCIVKNNRFYGCRYALEFWAYVTQSTVSKNLLLTVEGNICQSSDIAATTWRNRKPETNVGAFLCIFEQAREDVSGSMIVAHNTLIDTNVIISSYPSPAGYSISNYPDFIDNTLILSKTGYYYLNNDRYENESLDRPVITLFNSKEQQDAWNSWGANSHDNRINISDSTIKKRGTFSEAPTGLGEENIGYRYFEDTFKYIMCWTNELDNGSNGWADANGLPFKIVGFIGDSYTSFEGTSPEGYGSYYPHGDVTELSQMYMIDLCKHFGGLLVNASWSGTPVCGNPQSVSSFYGCSTKRVNDVGRNGVPDVIFVFMGLNDTASIGSWDEGDPIYDTQEFASEFKPAYALLCSKIQNTYPNAKVYCLSMPYTNSDKSNAISAVADAFDFTFLDISHVTFERDSQNHPTAAGQKSLADYILTLLV